MGTEPIPVLTKLSDSPHVIASPGEDIVGRKVTDRTYHRRRRQRRLARLTPVEYETIMTPPAARVA